MVPHPIAAAVVARRANLVEQALRRAAWETPPASPRSAPCAGPACAAREAEASAAPRTTTGPRPTDLTRSTCGSSVGSRRNASTTPPSKHLAPASASAASSSPIRASGRRSMAVGEASRLERRTTGDKPHGAPIRLPRMGHSQLPPNRPTTIESRTPPPRYLFHLGGLDMAPESLRTHTTGFHRSHGQKPLLLADPSDRLTSYSAAAGHVHPLPTPSSKDSNAGQE